MLTSEYPRYWRWTWRDCRTGRIRHPGHEGDNNRTGSNRSLSKDRSSSPAPARWRNPNRAPAWCLCSATCQVLSRSCTPTRKNHRRISAGSQSRDARGWLSRRGGPSLSACRKSPAAWIAAAGRRISPSPTAGCSSAPVGYPGCRRQRSVSPWHRGRDRPTRSSWWCYGVPGYPGRSESGQSACIWACSPASAGPAGILASAGSARTERWRPSRVGTRGRSPGRETSAGRPGAWVWDRIAGASWISFTGNAVEGNRTRAPGRFLLVNLHDQCRS